MRIISIFFMVMFLYGQDLIYMKNYIIDKKHALIWEDNGRKYFYTTKFGDKIEKEKRFTYIDALNYCSNLNLGGFKGWRLPTLKEILLSSLIYKNCKCRRGKYIFRNKDYKYLRIWTSTDTGDEKEKYIFDFYHRDIRTDKTYNGYRNWVICVKDLDAKSFNSKEELQTYVAGKLILGENISDEKYFFINDKLGKLKNLVFTTTPFLDTSKVVNNLLDMYVNVKPVPLPKLPPLPTFIKSQFETKEMFRKRVERELKKREEKVKILQKEYRDRVEKRNEKIKYIKKHLPQIILTFKQKAFQAVMGRFYFVNPKYDAENELMYVTLKTTRSNYTKRVALKVPLSIAREFYDNINRVRVEVNFLFKNNQIVLKDIYAFYNFNMYKAYLTKKDFIPTKLKIAISQNSKILKLQNPNLKDYKIDNLVYKDIDYNDDIPQLLDSHKQSKISKNRWLFVVGISKYDYTDNIAFASRSAKMFTKVMQKVFGIDKRHTYMLLDEKATTSRILNNLKLLLRDVKEGDIIYFYYAGHGIPNPLENNEPYILPSDEIPDFVVKKKELRLSNIYNILSMSRAKKVFVFVDSCFSGSTDGKSIIKGVAATRLVPKRVSFDNRKMAIITAAKGREFANMYKEKGERLFSYYLMKSILSGERNILDIYKDVYINVKKKSLEFGPLKLQEPELLGNKDLGL